MRKSPVTAIRIAFRLRPISLGGLSAFEGVDLSRSNLVCLLNVCPMREASARRPIGARVLLGYARSWSKLLSVAAQAPLHAWSVRRMRDLVRLRRIDVAIQRCLIGQENVDAIRLSLRPHSALLFTASLDNRNWYRDEGPLTSGGSG